MQGPVIAVSEVAVDFVRQIYTAQSNNIQSNSNLNFGFCIDKIYPTSSHYHNQSTQSYKTCRIRFTLLECLYSCIIQLAYWIRNHYSTLNKTLPSHKYIYGYGLKLYGMYLTTTTGFSSVLRSIQRLAFQKIMFFN